jgi:hypothetical protein
MKGGLGLFLDASPLYNEMEANLAAGATDYYKAGKAFGKLWKILFDASLNN